MSQEAMRVQNVIVRSVSILTALLLIAAGSVFDIGTTRAADLSLRSVSNGTGLPSAVTSYTFSFTPPSTNILGSLEFEFCTAPIAGTPCTAPLGFDISASTFGAESGNTGFIIDAGNTTANRLVLTRAPAAAIITASSYTLDNVTNPSTAGQTTYVRISEFASIDATGSRGDNGSVAFATVSAFSVGAFVPPYITLCIGVTVAINCSSATGFSTSFGEFSSATASLATTQFAVATNDPGGYNTFINGQTITSGNNPIAALSSSSPSIPGTAQFGFNLRANTVPVGGNNPAGPGTGLPTPNYNTSNIFRFVDGELIASSPISADFTRYTVSYLVNVPPAQPAGFYATTMTFTATAAF